MMTLSMTLQCDFRNTLRQTIVIAGDDTMYNVLVDIDILKNRYGVPMNTSSLTKIGI